ncbi:MAG: SRPBCC domain-containing protein [Myxococcales bacterium]|nr:SRPBCC domain-containing protein [Myxococcales bacterium]
MLTAEHTKTTIDHPTLTITFKRRFSVPPEAVFDAWTHPEQISEWWDPDGVPLVKCSIDLRVGGEFSFVNRGHGPPFAGVYRVIERPRCSCSMRWARSERSGSKAIAVSPP